MSQKENKIVTATEVPKENACDLGENSKQEEQLKATDLNRDVQKVAEKLERQKIQQAYERSITKVEAWLSDPKNQVAFKRDK